MEKNFWQVDESGNIENSFKLEYVDHLLDDGQIVGNCSLFSQQLLLKALFPILELHYDKKLAKDTSHWKEAILNSKHYNALKAFHVDHLQKEIISSQKTLDGLLGKKRKIEILGKENNEKLESVLQAAKKFKSFPDEKTKLADRRIVNLGQEILALESLAGIAWLLFLGLDYSIHSTEYFTQEEFKNQLVLLQSFAVIYFLIYQGIKRI